jgi:hypothetical protein
MTRLLSFALTCFACVCLLIATEQRAQALYVDPGSGLLVLQSAASVLAAVGFFLRRKIRALFGRRNKSADVCVTLPAEKGDTRKVA